MDITESLDAAFTQIRFRGGNPGAFSAQQGRENGRRRRDLNRRAGAEPIISTTVAKEAPQNFLARVKIRGEVEFEWQCDIQNRKDGLGSWWKYSTHDVPMAEQGSLLHHCMKEWTTIGLAMLSIL